MVLLNQVLAGKSQEARASLGNEINVCFPTYAESKQNI